MCVCVGAYACACVLECVCAAMFFVFFFFVLADFACMHSPSALQHPLPALGKQPPALTNASR